MSNKLTNSDLSLKAQFVARARPIAEKYQMVIWREDDEFYGRGVELPNSYGDGKTVEECANSTRESFVATVASLLQDGYEPPSPATEGKRDQQINIRVTSEERLLLETKARQSGASGISEYIRSMAHS
jgi:predicted RNase H-like HicB family nuclease